MFFWGVLFINPICWILFSIISIIRLNFSNFAIIFVALVFDFSNIYGYIRCTKGNTGNVKKEFAGVLTNLYLNHLFKK
jgi:hypothetical protein